VDPDRAVAALGAGDNPLTAREREVLDRARDGGTIAEIANDLHLSPGTARNHLSSVMQKLGAATRHEAVRTAEDQGWL
jgi:two-component system response regulator DesR